MAPPPGGDPSPREQHEDCRGSGLWHRLSDRDRRCYHSLAAGAPHPPIETGDAFALSVHYQDCRSDGVMRQMVEHQEAGRLAGWPDPRRSKRRRRCRHHCKHPAQRMARSDSPGGAGESTSPQDAITQARLQGNERSHDPRDNRMADSLRNSAQISPTSVRSVRRRVALSIR